MTRGQLKYKVRQNLNDFGVTYYSEDDLNTSIQDGYDEIVVYSECIEKFIDISVADLNAKPWTNFSDLIPDYYRVISILNQTTRSFIDGVADRGEDYLRADWQLKSSGNVYNYIISGPEWIGFSNSYVDAANKPLRIFYVATAPQLNDDSAVLKILNDYSKLLELYVTSDLLEQNQEFSKAQRYWQHYEVMLEDYRSKILLLSKADRIYTRSEQIFGV